MKIIKQFLIILFLIFLFVFYHFIKMDTHVSEANFVSCVDGDTAIFEIEGKQERVRFLAIDALEINEEYGKEASNYVCNALNKASRITLEFEEGSYKDKYNRVLAWVFVDDKLIQEDLVSKGFAQVKYLYDDYKYVKKLFDLQEKEKKKKIGLWGDQNERENDS